MFGQKDGQQDNTAIPDQAIDSVITDAAMPTTDNSSQWQHPGAPLDTTAAPVAPTAQPEPIVAPNDSALESPATPIESPAVVTPTTTPPVVSDDLIDIKQQALSQLSPLVSHLDQSPEEKFRTTMMMIQATDDQSLVKTAYEAAGQISDEKAKAQALLDIVNEINYFTQQHAN